MPPPPCVNNPNVVAGIVRSGFFVDAVNGINVTGCGNNVNGTSVHVTGDNNTVVDNQTPSLTLVVGNRNVVAGNVATVGGIKVSANDTVFSQDSASEITDSTAANDNRVVSNTVGGQLAFTHHASSNNVSNNALTGDFLFFDYAARNVVENNTGGDLSDYGFASDNVVEGNRASHAIEIRQSSNNTIRNNTAPRIYARFNSSSNIITDNVATVNSIKMQHNASHNVMSGNVATDMSEFSDASNNTVVNNTVSLGFTCTTPCEITLWRCAPHHQSGLSRSSHHFCLTQSNTATNDQMPPGSGPVVTSIRLYNNASGNTIVNNSVVGTSVATQGGRGIIVGLNASNSVISGNTASEVSDQDGASENFLVNNTVTGWIRVAHNASRVSLINITADIVTDWNDASDNFARDVVTPQLSIINASFVQLSMLNSSASAVVVQSV